MKSKSTGKGRAKKGRGRPAKDDALTATVQSRCTLEEYENFKEKAEAEGLTLSEWARATLNKAVEK